MQKSKRFHLVLPKEGFAVFEVFYLFFFLPQHIWSDRPNSRFHVKFFNSYTHSYIMSPPKLMTNTYILVQIILAVGVGIYVNLQEIYHETVNHFFLAEYIIGSCLRDYQVLCTWHCFQGQLQRFLILRQQVQIW